MNTGHDDLPIGMFLWGAVLGFISVGLITLFTAPKGSHENRQQITAVTQSVRARIETALPSMTDPVEESLAEGKATARQRREELGINGRASS